MGLIERIIKKHHKYNIEDLYMARIVKVTDIKTNGSGWNIWDWDYKYDVVTTFVIVEDNGYENYTCILKDKKYNSIYYSRIGEIALADVLPLEKSICKMAKNKQLSLRQIEELETKRNNINSSNLL